MRKQTKVAVVVSAAALLAMGASMTSFAKGWTLEDNEWVWLDSEGERVYGEWKKSVDGNYYYLDDETGVMATNRLVGDGDEDTYYVKEDGTRVVNDWVEVDNEDGITVGEEDAVEPASLWYYFGSNGKAYKGDGTEFKKASIGGNSFFFDENGVMQFGWVDYKDNWYYCGNEDDANVGVSRKGWQYLETEYIPDVPDGTYEEEEWVYLNSGKLLKDATKYIDGHYYSFDEYGIMEQYWHDPAGIASSADVASDAEAYAINGGSGVGVLADGWVKADYDEDGEFKWYYMVSYKIDDVNDKGETVKKTVRAIPFNQDGAEKAAKLIGGKTYLFDNAGKMLTGIQELDEATSDAGFHKVSSKKLDAGIYYFEKDGSNEGAMKTGKVTVTEDGEEFNYYFGKDGRAYQNAMKDNVIYGVDGKRIQAEDGNSYEIIDLGTTVIRDGMDDDAETKINGGEVVVSSTGKVRTSGTVRIDGERHKITFDKEAKKYTITNIEND